MPRGLAIGWAILPILALVGGGCGTRERQARARAVAEAYFHAVKDQDMERAQYEVRYARHAAAGTLVIFKPFARGEYRIGAHAITSRGLLGE